MEKDFHYYMTYAAARLAGLSRPDIIAYSCQFVDDNNEGQFLIDGRDAFFPEKLPSDGGYYYPIMTQSLSPKSLDPYVQRYVYVPFHFLPGDNNIVIKDKRNPLNTTPNSQNAQKLLDKALASGSPYQIGIAAHTFADTWSHQNFSGLREEWNAVYPWYDVFKSLVPDIGHAEAGHSPDIISCPWVDNRLGSMPIDNRERAFAAISVLYTKFQEKSEAGATWNDVKNTFRDFIDCDDYDARIEGICGHFGANEGVPAYDKDSWINAAVKRDGAEIVMQPGFVNTDWYKFHQAAKNHFAAVTELLKGI